jgi:hypothetical protein
MTVTLNVSGAVTNTLPPPVPVHQNYGSLEQYSGCMTAVGYKESYCEGYVDQQSSDSSVISAGNTLNIQAGSLTNVGSLITAGVNATINVAGPVVNQAQTLNAYWHSHWVQETGDFSSDKRHEVWGCGSAAECTALYGSAYTNVGGPIDPPTPVGNIAATIEAPNLSITSSGKIVNVGNVVGQSVSLTGTNLSNGITKSNTYTPVVGNPPQVISLAPAAGGLNLSIPATLGGNTSAQAHSALGQSSRQSSGATYVLGGTGTDLDRVTPQLLLSNLPANLQPSTTQFYYNPQAEDAALQTQALKETGQATFVNGLSSDSQQQLSITDQEKIVLYANAEQYAKANNVQLGQALTQQQLGELTQPMLWYVEQTVPEPGCSATGTLTCPTVTALMPQVYLPANTSALSADGNIVASDSIKLNFGNKDNGGSILNTGTIASGGSLTVNTGTLTNQANQVDVGQIWTNAGTDPDAGYEETTGTVVQPGGFMTAAAGQMTLNVSQLNQIGALLAEVNPDGSTNNAATQQLLGQVLQQLGGNFKQTTVSDDLHTNFVAAGGFGVGQLVSMIAAVALSALGMPILAAMLASLISQSFSSQGFSLGQVLEAGAVAMATEGLDSGLQLNNVSLSQVGGDIAHGAASAAEIAQGAGEVIGQSLVSAGVNTIAYGGSFGRDFENGVVGNLAAVGAGAIGTLNADGTFGSGATQELLYTAAHGALGCAASAAEGTGCAGGAIGGAASAALSPDLLKAIDPTGAALDPGQQAVMAGFASLLGGGLAGLAGANAQGGATAAQNEVLNNTDKHPEDAAKNGGALSQFGSFLSAAGSYIGDQLASAGRGAVNMGNQFLGLMNANSGQTPPSDPNPLVQANDGNWPNTGASPVTPSTPATPVCDPPVCTVMPGLPGTPSHITISSGNSGDDTGSGASGQGPSTGDGNMQIDDSRAGHIFRDSDGHISDTPANRQLLESVANDPSAVLGTDKYGTTWAAKTNPDGTQTWVGIRGGKVSYGGINQTPKAFDPQTGLASPMRPGK